MFFYIKIFSKEKKKLNEFLVFFSRLELFSLNLKQQQKQKSHKFVTVLKSPHINKTAQEQFEFKIFTRQILMFSVKPFLCLFIIKRMIKLNFPGIKIKLILTFNKKKHNKILLSILNPDNVVFNFIKNNNKKKKIKYNNYLKMFDYYGETYLHNLSI